MAVIATSTKISDVIVPEIFTPYIIEKTAEKSRILQSGIAVANPKLNELVTAGGLTIQMPFWQDLTGDDEVLADDTALTPGKIGAAKDVAALLMRGKAWGANDLAGALAGDDPMAAIGERVSDYWARKEQKTLVAVLAGVFASSTMADHVLDKSSNTISAEIVLDGKQLLGDNAESLQAIMMHSAVYTKLQKLNLIQYTTVQGPSGSPITIPTYLTYSVVVDDGMPVVDNITTHGVYSITVSTAATAGDKITIGGVELTFVANSATPGDKEVKVGATPTAAEQATNIAAWFNAQSAGLKDSYTIAASSDKVTFTGKLTTPSTQVKGTATKAAGGSLVIANAVDTAEVNAPIYTTYLFARGSIGRGEGTPVSFVPTETDRDSLAGEDYLINRRAFVLHPMGIKWIGTPAGTTPTNSELATGANWSRVYESKNIGMVAIKHLI